MKQAMELGRRLVLAALLGSVWAATALAATITITHGGNSVDLDFVPIGNPGNAANANGWGDVDYEYAIGTYEISVNQWNASGIGAPSAGFGTRTGDQPASVGVRFWDVARYCNWLTSGDENLGVYTVGALPAVTAIDREGALATYGTIFVAPTVDEWFKAAFYNADGEYYSMYATGGAAAPSEVDRPDATIGSTNPFEAVYSADGGAAVTAPADIDNAGGLSWYGTMGQNGNVFEFLERPDVTAGTWTVGGGYNANHANMRSTFATPGAGSVWNANINLGFRVAMLDSVVIPEPSAMVLLVLGTLGVTARRKRR